jgi:hypothetical protein
MFDRIHKSYLMRPRSLMGSAGLRCRGVPMSA